MDHDHTIKSVYVMSAGDERHKVGISWAPSRRRSALSGAVGYDLALIHVQEVENAAAVERAAHWLLRDFRLHGEWFGVTAEVAISAIKSGEELVRCGFPALAPAAAPQMGRAPARSTLSARPQHRLTMKQVEQATGPVMLADGGGLYLKVDRSGAKRWVFIFFWEGRRREKGLGPLRTVHLYEAREVARESRKLVAAGVDPIANNALSRAA